MVLVSKVSTVSSIIKIVAVVSIVSNVSKVKSVNRCKINLKEYYRQVLRQRVTPVCG